MPVKRQKLAVLLAAFCLMLPFLLSGCEGQGEPESSVSSQEASPTPKPTPTPEPTAEPTPEASPTPEPSSGPSFEEVFADNMIDEKLAEDLDSASSTNAILTAYSNAAKSWQIAIPSFYTSALEVLSDNDKESLRQEHGDWQNTVEEEVDQILLERGEDSDSQVSAAIAIMKKYRDHAQALCEICFSGKGELPDFDAALTAGPMG